MKVDKPISNKNTLLRFILKAIKLPFLLFMLGLGVRSLVYFPQIAEKYPDNLELITDISSMLILLSFLLFGYLLIIAICNSYRKNLEKKRLKTAMHVMTIIKNGMTTIFILGAINIIISILTLRSEYLVFANNVIIVIIIAAVAWTLLEILSMVENIIYENQKTVALYTKIKILRNIAAILIIVLAVAASLMVFDKVRHIGISLLASAGFLTAIFALAAQRSLGSVFVGIQLLLAQPLKIGDYITIENESGVVEEITLSNVVIRLWDLRRLILPINFFIEKPFQNWSRSKEGVVGAIKLFVDYTLPIAPLRDELIRILKESPNWDSKQSNLSVHDFKENTVELRMIVSAENPASLDILRAEVREQLLNFLREHHHDCLPKIRVLSNS